MYMMFSRSPGRLSTVAPACWDDFVRYIFLSLGYSGDRKYYLHHYMFYAKKGTSEKTYESTQYRLVRATCSWADPKQPPHTHRWVCYIHCSGCPATRCCLQIIIRSSPDHHQSSPINTNQNKNKVHESKTETNLSK